LINLDTWVNLNDLAREFLNASERVQTRGYRGFNLRNDYAQMNRKGDVVLKLDRLRRTHNPVY
jgi:hypothetical protein